MVSNKFKFKKTTVQLILLTVGVLLIFLIYFSDSNNNKKTETLKDVSNAQKDSKENEDINIFEDVEYKGVDNNGNKFVILSEYSDFKIDKSEIINMKGVLCYFYFKDGKVLEIRSKTGTYNNVTLDMNFAKNVNMFYQDNALFSDKANFSNAENRLVVEGNVKTQGPDGELIGDKLNFDFIDKKLKISMYNEDRIKIKTNF